MSESLEVKVAEHGQRIKGLEKRVENVESDNRSLSRLTTLLEEQMKVSNQRDERHSEVLDKINENLTGLNSRFDHVEKRVGYLETTHKDNLIDINKLWKDIIFKVIPSVIGGLILAWLVVQFGLK